MRIRYLDYLKRFINKKNEVFFHFSIKYRFSNISLKNVNFIYSDLFCCYLTCYFVGMVSETSASSYVTSS